MKLWIVDTAHVVGAAEGVCSTAHVQIMVSFWRDHQKSMSVNYIRGVRSSPLRFLDVRTF